MQIIRRWQIVSLVCLTTLAGLALAAETAKPKAKQNAGIKFEISEDAPSISNSKIPTINYLSPSYVAILNLRNLPPLDFRDVKKSKSARKTSSSSTRERTMEQARERALTQARARQSMGNSDQWYNMNFCEADVNIKGNDFIDAILETKAAKTLGSKSREMIKKAKSIAFQEGIPAVEFKVFAYNKADAETLVKAIVEVFEKYAAANTTLAAKEIDQIRSGFDLKKKDSDEKANSYKELTTKIRRIKKSEHYPADITRVEDRILRLNGILETKMIEMAGMEARMKAIHVNLTEMKSKNVRGQAGLKEELESMLVKLEIDFATISGECNSATDMRLKAEDYILLTDKRLKSRNVVRTAREELQKWQKKLDRFEGLLAKDQADWFMPVVAHEVVTIYSLANKEKIVKF